MQFFTTIAICTISAYAAILPRANRPILATQAPPRPTIATIVAPTVTIANGVLVGKATTVDSIPKNTAIVNAFLGIPFAQPPVRFAPPVSPSSWTTTKQAVATAPACIQQFLFTGEANQRLQTYFNNPFGLRPAESEDCLYLNVFAPRAASPTNLKPVLVWVFGGNLQFGSGSLLAYNGTSFALNQDVVVVTPNYRTNIFGFSNSPEIPLGQQNSGYLDQRMALAWVQKNIKQFGGDPTKVMIFGESAGGESVRQLLANPPSPLPYHAAILESPASALAAVGTVSYSQVLTHFGCLNMACLRQIRATDIQSYIEAQSILFPPVNDDVTNSHNVNPNIISKKFANVPVLVGHNAQEFQVFQAILGIQNGSDTTGQVFKALNIPPSAQTQLLQTYAAQGLAPGYDTAGEVVTDAVFTCPAAALASSLTMNGYRAWRYRYEGHFPNLAFYPGALAYHTAEISLVWGTFPLGGATANQFALSKYMQGVWANFALNPSAGPGWPQVGTNNGNELGVIGGDMNPTGEFTKPLITEDYPCYAIEPLLPLST